MVLIFLPQFWNTLCPAGHAAPAHGPHLRPVRVVPPQDLLPLPVQPAPARPERRAAQADPAEPAGGVHVAAVRGGAVLALEFPVADVLFAVFQALAEEGEEEEEQVLQSGFHLGVCLCVALWVMFT